MMISTQNKKYILNPEYALTNDIDRIVLASRSMSGAFTTFTHPVIALYLSFFTGEKTMGENIREIASTLGCTEEEAYDFISPLIENEDKVYIKYDDRAFSFPEFTLIENTDGQTRELKRDDYIVMPPYDFSTKRLHSPSRVQFIINTKCVTDCRYCYADRHTQYESLTTDQILGLIDQCKKIGITYFGISGGELFTQKNWDKILKTAIDNDYKAHVSTKYPLTSEMVDMAWNAGMRSIQVSLDSMSPEILAKNLKVQPYYIDKLKKSIGYLDRKGIKILLRSNLTDITATTENIREIIEFIKGFKNIETYHITFTGYSLYKSCAEFNEFKPSMEQVRTITEYLDSYQDDLHFKIELDDMCVSTEADYKSQEEFEKRPVCSGNISSLIVLPDGKVTICEELYWNKNFLIGDFKKDSLLDIWHSQKAVDLWKLSRNSFPDNSPCKKCDDMEQCRYNKGVCWRNVIAYYGEENWLHPEISCVKAPMPTQARFYDNSFIKIGR